MSEVRSEQSSKVIRQMLSPSQSQLTRADKALEKNLHKAFAQSALQLFSLNLQILDHGICHEFSSAIPELTEPFLMLGLLESCDAEPGFIALDHAALTGLVTIQTLGVILPNLTQSRAATLTDAALIAPLIDHAMQKIDRADADIGHINQYRFSKIIVDAHRLSLTIRSDKFAVYQMNLAMGPDQHPGQILIAFPAIEQKSKDKNSATKDDRTANEKVFMALPAELIAEIRHFQFPWSELSQLKVGTHLILPDAALENIQLRAANSSDIISAKLGRLAHFRAVQVDIAVPSVDHLTASSITEPKQIKNNAEEPKLFERDDPKNITDPERPKLDAPIAENQVATEFAEGASA